MAKKFIFRLEPVLKIRTEKVNEAKNSLRNILQFRYQKEDEIEALTNTKNEFMDAKQQTINAATMQANKDYMQNLNAQIVKKEQEKVKIIEIENERRDRLAESVKDEKILLKLKEKKETEYLKEIAAEETKFLDEVATTRYINNKD